MKRLVTSESGRSTLRVLVAVALSGAALVSLGLLAGVGFAKSSVSAAQYKNSGCTNATLSGAYGTRSFGNQSPTQSLTPVGENTPRVSTGRLDFDGIGHATGVVYANPPGTTSADGNAAGVPVDLDYQVRPDCTGFARVTNGPALAFVLIDVKTGVAGEFESMTNSPGNYLLSHGTRMFP